MLIAKIQEIVAEKFSVEVMEDWMFDTSEDFQIKNGKELEDEIKAQLPELADNELLIK
jgi:hypothetical protein